MTSDNDTHERLRSAAPVAKSSEKSFGIVFSVVFLIIAAWPLLDGAAIRWWPIGVSIAFLLCAFFWPVVLRPFNRLWTNFGLLLHRIVNPLVLGIIFFLVVSPIGLLMRALGKRPLALEFEPEKSSYWINRDPPGPPAEGMKNQF